MGYEYYPSAQVQTVLSQREHDDRYITEVLGLAGQADIDISDFMVNDIEEGNTATVRSMYKRLRLMPEFKPFIVNGSVGGNYNHGTIEDQTFYGACPVRDDYILNEIGEGSYYDLPVDHPRRRKVERYLRAHNLGLEELHTAVIAPEDIPPIYIDGAPNPEFKEYKNTWEYDPKLQAEYPTIEEYHAHLVEALVEQREEISNISDIRIFTAGSAANLGEANVVAMYYTAAHIYPQITHNGTNPRVKSNFPAQNYIYELTVEDFVVVCGWKAWSHVIRKGVVRNKFDSGDVKWKRRKSGYNFYSGSAANKRVADGDPIISVVQNNTLEGSLSGTTCLEIHVQLDSLQDGTQVYGEIRIWDYSTLHGFTDNYGSWRGVYATISGGSSSSEILVDDGETYITKIEQPSFPTPPLTISNEGDGSMFSISDDGTITSNDPLDYATQETYHIKLTSGDSWGDGSAETTYINIRVLNINNEPEPPPHDNPFKEENDSDVGFENVLFPLEYKAAKEVPFFMRERFLRESVVICVYAVKRIKLKWYQSGIFSIVVWIIGVLFSWITGGASLTFATLVTTAITAIIKMVVVKIVLAFLNSIIDAPWLLAVLQLAYSVMTQDFSMTMNLSSLATYASTIMSAVNTYQASELQNKMEELQESADEFADQMKDSQSELDKLMEEAGTISEDDRSLTVKYLFALAKVETYDDMVSRTLDLDSALVMNVDGMLDLDSKLKTI